MGGIDEGYSVGCWDGVFSRFVFGLQIVVLNLYGGFPQYRLVFECVVV